MLEINQPSIIDKELPEIDQSTSGETTNGRRNIVLVNLVLVNMVIGINYAILTPFFPLEASKKNVSNSVVGFIFGEFELIIFLTAPIFGSVIPKIGAKFMFISGLFGAGLCCVLFGLLAYCPPGSRFIATALVVRGVMAVGSSMQVTASLAITAALFPQRVAAMFGLLETFMGVGMLIGPPVGGVLFQAVDGGAIDRAEDWVAGGDDNKTYAIVFDTSQVGGFMAPFAVVGGLILLTVPFSMIFMDFDSSCLPSQTGSFVSMLTNPHILFASSILWGLAATIGFLDPILQPFLSKEFHLTQMVVGFVLLCYPTMYAILTPLVGYLCDKKPVAKQLMSVSLLFLGFSMMMLNPSPLLHISHPNLWLSIGSLFMIGIGYSFAFAPSTNDILTECLIMGYQDNFGTFSLVSGLINSCISLGYCLGPIMAGVMTDRYGFPWSTTYMGLLILGMGTLYSLYTVIYMYVFGGRHRVVPREVLETDERQPLLAPL